VRGRRGEEGKGGKGEGKGRKEGGREGERFSLPYLLGV